MSSNPLWLNEASVLNVNISTNGEYKKQPEDFPSTVVLNFCRVSMISAALGLSSGMVSTHW